MKRPLCATAGPAMCLSSLPESVLHEIFRLLSAQDLAALSLQDKYLRAVASDSALWEPLALARWPGADAAAGYGGDWHALFFARACMPHALPLAADRVRAVTAAQRQRRQAEQREAAAAAGGAGEPGAAQGGGGGGSSGPGGLPQLAFEDVMRQAFSAGLACTRDRAVRRTAEWRGLKADLTWWAAERPEVLVAFIRSAHDALAGASWASAHRFEPWRRSSVAFLLELGLLGGAHASVAARLAAEAAALDGAIQRAQRGGGGGISGGGAPADVPASHWWWAAA